MRKCETCGKVVEDKEFSMHRCTTISSNQDVLVHSQKGVVGKDGAGLMDVSGNKAQANIEYGGKGARPSVENREVRTSDDVLVRSQKGVVGGDGIAVANLDGEGSVLNLKFAEKKDNRRSGQSKVTSGDDVLVHSDKGVVAGDGVGVLNLAGKGAKANIEVGAVQEKELHESVALALKQLEIPTKLERARPLPLMLEGSDEQSKMDYLLDVSRRRRKEIEDPQLLVQLGNLERVSNNLSEALNNYKRAAQILKLKNDQRGLANCYEHIAYLLEAAERVPEAIQWYQECLKIRKNLNDLDGQPTSYNNLGMAYYKLKQHDRAFLAFREAAAMDERQGHPQEAATQWNNLGMLYRENHDLAHANECFEKAMRLYDSVKDMGGVDRVLKNMSAQ